MNLFLGMRGALIFFFLNLALGQQLITMTLYNSTTCVASTKNALGGPFIFRVPSTGPSNCVIICVDTVIPGCYGHIMQTTTTANTMNLSVYASTACAGSPFPASSPVLSPSSNPTQTCNLGSGPLIGYYLNSCASRTFAFGALFALLFLFF